MSPSQASFRLFFAQHLHQLSLYLCGLEGARNSPAPKLKAKVACADQQIGGQFAQSDCSYKGNQPQDITIVTKRLIAVKLPGQHFFLVPAFLHLAPLITFACKRVRLFKLRRKRM